MPYESLLFFETNKSPTTLHRVSLYSWRAAAGNGYQADDYAAHYEILLSALHNNTTVKHLDINKGAVGGGAMVQALLLQNKG
jgi:hypothetical protein